MGKPDIHVGIEVPRFGEFARQLAGVRSGEIARALAEQERTGERIGEILVRHGVMLRDQVWDVLRAQADWAANMHSHDLRADSFPLTTTFSLCMPCYNEADVIEDCLDSAFAILPAFLEEFEVVVVDDGSSDATAEIVQRYSQRESRVRLVQHPTNLGYGSAVTSGLRAADGELVCFTDGDGQFNLVDLPNLLVNAQDADVVVGYRYRRADTPIRKLNAHSWNFLIRKMLGVRIRDLDCAFKLFQKRVVDGMQLTSEGACISAEIIVQCTRAGLTIAEVPVNHFPRYRGKATGGNLKVIAKAFRELPSLYKYRKMEPMSVAEPDCLQNGAGLSIERNGVRHKALPNGHAEELHPVNGSHVGSERRNGQTKPEPTEQL